MKKTIVINLIASPGSGKTTIAALLFAELKMKGYLTEFVQEYIKKYIWKNDYDTIMDQFYISRQQYELQKNINGKVDFIVTDGSLIHGLFYNRYNKNNISNVEKTEDKLKEYLSEFHNIFLFIERGQWKYEQEGRIHTEKESIEISDKLKEMLDEFKLPYRIFDSSKSEIENMINYIFEIKQMIL